MERHIGTWHKETVPEKSKIAELIIDGNSIEFYSRFHSEVFPATFIGNDGEFNYKVFVNGSSRSSNKKTLEYTSSHRVSYVLMQNFEFSKGTDISGIKEFSFYIPEIINWLGLTTVFYTSTTENELAAAEKHLEPIIINNGNPYIELYFESKTYKSILDDDRTGITIKKEPRIKVKYNDPQSVHSVMEDAKAYDEIVFAKPGIYKYTVPWFDHIEEDTRDWFGNEGEPMTQDFYKYLEELEKRQFEGLRDPEFFASLKK